MDSRLVERAILSPELRLWSAVTELHSTPATAEQAVQLILEARTVSGITFLDESAALRQVLAGTGPLSDCHKSQRAWESGRDLLLRTDPASLVRLVEVADLVGGLDGRYGEIRSLSNPSVPGLVIINTVGPAATIAEQMVHECAHIVFAASLEGDEKAEILREEAVAALSPFTDSARPVERIAHGIVAYSAVWALWRAIARDAAIAEFTESVTHNEALELCERRLLKVGRRLRLGTQALSDVAGKQAVQLCLEFVTDTLDLSVGWQSETPQKRREIVLDAGYNTDLSRLTPIQRAEVELAAAGLKVSRVSVSARDAGVLGFAVQAHAAVVSSAYGTSAVADPALDDFSNVALGRMALSDVAPEDELYLFVSADPNLARACALHDIKDEASGFYGIPECCRDWFLAEWQDGMRDGGDLFARMIRAFATNGQIVVAKECDASAMYRGGGLCWHFPCSPFCTRTIQAIRERRRYLALNDGALLFELEQAYRPQIALLPTGGYTEADNRGSDAVVISFEDGHGE